MQKILAFFLLTVVLLAGCSKDDDSNKDPDKAPSELIVTIDGVKKTFNTISVDSSVSFRYITASINNDPTEFFYMELVAGSTGINGSNIVRYSDGSAAYGFSTSPFNLLIQENTSSRIKGTFSGELMGLMPPNTIKNFTNGSFTINF